jgi:site-specific recombinase XerD
MAETRGKNKNLVEAGNPRLLKKEVKGGTEYSLYLEYQLGYNRENGASIRKKETLSLYLKANPRTPVERQQNKETLALAKKIQFERSQELLDNKEGYRLKKKDAINLLDYFEQFAKTANVADRLVLVGALNNYKDFLGKKYPQYANWIEAKNLSSDMMQKFVDYLVENHKGQGAETYYKRFKRMINYAVENEVIAKSPCKGITTPKTDDILAKDILSEQELQKLFATHYAGENPEIRRAFAMTCLSGIRHCDIVTLTYSEVDYSNKILKFRQNKTKKHSSSSGVTIPLNDTLLNIIGVKAPDAKDDYIFHLPSDTMCLKALRHWTKKAGIDKHITWHCGRHSFGTQLLNNGANIKVVSSLLGHSSLRFTEIYVRAVDEEKKKAINSMPSIDIL